MRLIIGCDEAAYDLKMTIIEHLRKKGIEPDDFGANKGEVVLYPDVAYRVADEIAKGNYDRGILLCGTGIGMSMVANKVEGVRAALCSDCFSAQATREHNNANILCMGARTIGPGLALMIVDKFVDTPFSNDERHVRRIKMFS